jgi:hypothetical protein
MPGEPSRRLGGAGGPDAPGLLGRPDRIGGPGGSRTLGRTGGPDGSTTPAGNGGPDGSTTPGRIGGLDRWRNPGGPGVCGSSLVLLVAPGYAEAGSLVGSMGRETAPGRSREADRRAGLRDLPIALQVPHGGDPRFSLSSLQRESRARNGIGWARVISTTAPTMHSSVLLSPMGLWRLVLVPARAWRDRSWV